MQLKLAEYKDGKSERFLELGEEYEGHQCQFGYYGDFIKVYSARADSYGDGYYKFEKDEKDPLNRFPDASGKGLFDGKTYGDGRFVLVKDEDFGVYEQRFFDKEREEFSYGLSLDGKISCTFKNASRFAGKYVSSTLPKLIGNLIENPELWEKVKL